MNPKQIDVIVEVMTKEPAYAEGPNLEHQALDLHGVVTLRSKPPMLLR